MMNQGPVPDSPDGGDDEQEGAAPLWMKAVLTAVPFALLLGLLFLEKCRTGG